MAITSSAKKAIRGAERKAVYNDARNSAMKHITKTIKKLISEKRIKEAKELIPQAQKAIDKAVKTNLIKHNAGSRKKSRLAALVNKVVSK